MPSYAPIATLMLLSSQATATIAIIGPVTLGRPAALALFYALAAAQVQPLVV
jgi:hypothetical protein